MSKPDHFAALAREHQSNQAPESSKNALLDVDIESIPSPTLTRLIEEVRNDANVGRAYNRTYHRHNR